MSARDRRVDKRDAGDVLELSCGELYAWALSIAPMSGASSSPSASAIEGFPS